MSLKNWNELPLLVKRNPKKFFDYLSEELGLDVSWDDLTQTVQDYTIRC